MLIIIFNIYFFRRALICLFYATPVLRDFCRHYLRHARFDYVSPFFFFLDDYIALPPLFFFFFFSIFFITRFILIFASSPRRYIADARCCFCSLTPFMLMPLLSLIALMSLFFCFLRATLRH